MSLWKKKKLRLLVNLRKKSIRVEWRRGLWLGSIEGRAMRVIPIMNSLIKNLKSDLEELVLDINNCYTKVTVSRSDTSAISSTPTQSA